MWTTCEQPGSQALHFVLDSLLETETHSPFAAESSISTCYCILTITSEGRALRRFPPALLPSMLRHEFVLRILLYLSVHPRLPPGDSETPW
jgi:hypothetical protein